MSAKRKSTPWHSTGFTLMELLTVLVIMGILAALIAPRVTTLPTRTSPQIIQFLEHEMRQAVAKRRAVPIYYTGKSLTSPATHARLDLAAGESIEVVYPKQDDYLPSYKLTTFYPDGTMTATEFRYLGANTSYAISVSPISGKIAYKPEE